MCAEPAWPKGVGRLLLEEVDSTNAEAARIAGSLTEPVWIIAERQTAGRGRRGRPWAMPHGNFAATLVMRPAEPVGEVALRSFVAALALSDGLVAAGARQDAVTLKWPNDVLLNGGKVGGILLESTGTGGKVVHLAIGIGVNLAEAPDIGALEPGALRPVSLQGETGLRITPEDFLTLLAAAYAGRETVFAQHGFAPIRTAWLAQAARLGQEMTARTASAVYHGRFETVDPRGALVLVTDAGRVSVPAADVYF